MKSIRKIAAILLGLCALPSVVHADSYLIDSPRQIKPGIIYTIMAPYFIPIAQATSTLRTDLTTETLLRTFNDSLLFPKTGGTITGDVIVSSDIFAANVTASSSVTAGYFHGDGSGITGLTGIVAYETDPLSLHLTGGLMTGPIKMGITQSILGGTPGASSSQSGGGGLDPNTVDLGVASNFAILSGAGITNNTPPSVITGDIGVSPIAEAAITGFVLTDFGSYATSPQVAGFVYAADMSSPTPSNLTLAKGALTAAYGDAAGRAPDDTNIGAGDLCGLTVSSGTHKFSAAAAASCSFTLTGNAQAVFIFQVGSALTVSNGVVVTLSGGVLPKNIFWQVGTSASLGSGVTWQGTIIADQAITVNTGSTINGRLLASVANVTLLADTIVVPSSTSFLGGHPAALAFDGNNATYWASTATAPQSLSYDFGAGNSQFVTRYSLRNVGVGGGIHDPTAWTFVGSTDNVNWVTLDTQLAPIWAQPETKTVNIVSTAAYRYFSANFSACGTDCGISEMTLFTSTTSLTIFPSGDITTIGTITAGAFVGNGAGLTNIPPSAPLITTVAAMNISTFPGAGIPIIVSDASAPYSICVTTGTLPGAAVLANTTTHCQ